MASEIEAAAERVMRIAQHEGRKDVYGHNRTYQRNRYSLDLLTVAAELARRLAADREIGDRTRRCRFCGAIATCHGTYEGDTGFACDACCGHGCEDGHCDSIADLCDAYLDRLAADRAELEERARPIDAEWLESIGFTPDGVLELGGTGRMTWRPSHGDVMLWGYPGTACSTRGRLLDLLIAMKGGA